MDINKEKIERIERKTLGEDCWLSIGEDIKIKIDYLTRAQEMEYERLLLGWTVNQGAKLHSHDLEYYFRCTVKDIQGITIEGREAVLERKNDMARELVTNEVKDQQRLDIVACFIELKIFLYACELIMQKLAMTEADKKKLQSVQNSVKQENSDGQEKSSEAATS
jgi:hypothetical protein